MTRLAGKIALVTGAGREIGKGIALAYAREGAFVVCTARTASEVSAVVERIAAQGGGARAVTADITAADNVRRLFELGLEDKTCLDILVANGGRGTGADKAAVAKSDPEIWRDLLDVNLLGAYLCVRESIPYLLKADAAKIIMMGSGSRLRTPPGHSAYSAAKAGLWALTRTLAVELKSHGVAVNKIIPGPVLKEHMLTAREAPGNRRPARDRAAQRRVAQGSGRFGGARALSRDAAAPGTHRAKLQSAAELTGRVPTRPLMEADAGVHAGFDLRQVGEARRTGRQRS